MLNWRKLDFLILRDLLSRIEKVLRDELPVHTRSIQGGSGSDWQGRQESRYRLLQELNGSLNKMILRTYSLTLII